MTYLEKAKELNPTMTTRKIFEYCPEDLGLEPMRACDYGDNCRKCWNRGMPEKEG